MGMPSDASTSLAWYSRNFTIRPALACGELVSRRGRCERTSLVRAAVRPAVTEASLKVGVADKSERPHDAQDDHDEQGDAAADQDGGPGRLSLNRRRRVRPADGRLYSEGTPRGAIPVTQPVVRDPATLSILARHLESLRLLLHELIAGCCRASVGCAGAPSAGRFSERGSARGGCAPAR
jgi:hypothetical protein